MVCQCVSLTYTAVREISQVDVDFMSSQSDLSCTEPGTDFDCVKEMFILHNISALSQSLRQQQRGVVDLLGDGLKALGTCNVSRAE